MNEVEIGTIKFSNIIKEAEVTSIRGRFNPKKIGECKICVYLSEGQIPHFHIFNLNKTFNCCVRIYEAYFFSHGNIYRDILNSSQCKELNKWLKYKNSKDQNLTNWEYISKIWKMSNPECLYPEYLIYNKQPDYNNMMNFRDTI